MFEQTFKNIDDILHKDAGCTSELDYTEQSSWLLFLKNSDILQCVIYHSQRAAGQIGLTKETLEPYPIALPLLAVQQTTVETIMKLESETQRLASLYQQKLAALAELKKSLLHQAFSGEL